MGEQDAQLIIQGVILGLATNAAETVLLLGLVEEKLPGTMKLIFDAIEEQLPGIIEETYKNLSEAQDEQSQAAVLLMESVSQSDATQAVASAKQGAKLTYIKNLRGQCPEGYLMMFFKVGGKVCSKCMKLAQAKKSCDGMRMEKGGISNVVNKFKTEHVKKCQKGSDITKEACGGKAKKRKC